MIYAIFFVAQPGGRGHLAVCESFNGWNYHLSELTPETEQAAENDLRRHIAETVRFVRYEVPIQNQRFAEKLMERVA